MRGFITRICLTIALFISTLSLAQILPSGYIGAIQSGNTANQFSNYSYSFTPTSTGSDYVLFAFRQDPAYWTFGNVSLTANGSTTNMLINGNMASGGSITVPLNNGTTTVQAPNSWGVFYQTGHVPSAAGTWRAPSTGGLTTTGVGTGGAGSWYDGAVGSFDGIYQAVSVTAGTTYSISFSALSNNVANTSSVQLGVYAGECANLSLAAASCTLPTSMGFTTLATPAQGSGAGTPVGPTVVSTGTGTPIVATSQSNGAIVTTTAAVAGITVVAIAVNNTTQRQSKTLEVTQTTTTTQTTPITTTVTQTTPVTTTTITTPTTVTRYSDGTSTTVNGTPVTTTAIVNNIVTTSSVANAVQVSEVAQQFSTRIDMYDQLGKINSNVNQTLVSDPFIHNTIIDGRIKSRGGSNDGVSLFLTDNNQLSNTVGGYKYSNTNVGMGLEKRVDAFTLIGATYSQSAIHLNGDANNASGDLTKNNINLYAVKTIKDWILKGDIGYSNNKYSTTHILPELNMQNSSDTNGKDAWIAARIYAPSRSGVRTYIGTRFENNQTNATTESGSSLTAVSYVGSNNNKGTQEFGIRYDHPLGKKWAIGGEISNNTNGLKQASIALTYADSKDSSILLKLGEQQQGSQRIDGAQLQMKINF